MALHTDLPIYRDSLELFKLVMVVTSNVRRDHKQLFGKQLQGYCTQVLLFIGDANSTIGEDRAADIDSLLRHLRAIEVNLRALRDLGLVPTEKYADTIQLTQGIGKQAGGWRRKALTPVS